MQSEQPAPERPPRRVGSGLNSLCVIYHPTEEFPLFDDASPEVFEHFGYFVVGLMKLKAV